MTRLRGRPHESVQVTVASLLTLLLLGLNLALRPWSVLVAIFLVTARNGLRKEIAYLSGWVAALLLVAGVTMLLYPELPHGSSAHKSHGGVEVAVGLVIGGWLLWRWRRRKPADVQMPKQPAWIARLDTISPFVAFGLGAFLPSYIIVIAAVDEMISSGLSQGGLVLAALGWVFIASLGAASPLWPLVSDRQHAPATYQRWRTWITEHNRAVLYATGGVVCVALTAKGLLGLFN
jgi:hypothetical protein